MKGSFTDRDLAQIEQHGQKLENILSQMERFRRGFGFLKVRSAATAGDGITVLDPQALEYFANKYRDTAHGQSIVKFVPASGAATRMFKDLFAYVNEGRQSASIDRLLDNIEKFAFYEIIRDKAAAGPYETIKAVLDYGASLPKGLIRFHKYDNETRTAVEEHLTEGAMYARSGDWVNIHFTVSPEHEEGFRTLLADVLPKYEKRFGVRYDIAFSQQQPSTDTIAVTPDNEPFREENGSLLFRPAGHGALLENLDKIDADIVFIKNIDNVTVDRLKDDTVLYKMALGGILLELRRKIYNWLEILDRGYDDTTIRSIAALVEDELSLRLPEAFERWENDEQADYLYTVLNRPLRVCAMVRNEGEPGGGPFWVANADGSVSLQIGESSQIAPEQAHLFREGTHFNPVDVVCSLRDHKGQKFDLREFTDPATGFISEKSKDGRTLKALELPGLWNGAMANWNTVFVEVPVSTFTPVKEVTDLLRPQHRQEKD